MPHDLIWDKDGVLVKFRGRFDFKANSDANCKIYSDPRSNNISYIIYDTSDISGLFLSDSEISVIALEYQLMSSRSPGLKVAFWAPDEQTLEICERYPLKYQSHQTGWQFIVSDNLERVKNWISARR